MWLFMLFALVIYEMIVETRKENARRARAERVMKFIDSPATGGKSPKCDGTFDPKKWEESFYAQCPIMDPRNKEKYEHKKAQTDSLAG